MKVSFSLTAKNRLLLFALLWICFANSAHTVIAQSSPQKSSEVRFTILQMNDVYEITQVGGEGGMARVATLRKRLLKNNPNTYTVLAGDLFSPSALGTAKVNGERLAGKQIVAIMNSVGLDYMTFGNHEFDVNEEQFKQRMSESKFQWFSSNAMNAQGESFPDVPEHRIIDVSNKNGKSIKVGMFGLTIPSTVKPYVTYKDVFKAAENQVKELRPQVDILIAMTHLAFTDDMKISEQFPQIDLIIGGHEHVHHAFEKGNLPPIFKADANARTVYLHYFSYDTATKKLSRNSILRKVDKSTPEDTVVKKEVEKWVKLAYDGFKKDGFDPEKRVVLSSLALDGSEESVRSKETDLTKIITDGMFKEFEGADLAVFNGGSIRIDDTIPPGPITEYDVIRILPFGGKVVFTEIKGSLLQKFLDQGMANRGTGGFLLKTNVSQGDDGKTWLISGQPLDSDKQYKMVVSDFLLTGREQNMAFFSKDNPDLKIIKEGSDIRQTTINQLKVVFK